MSLHHLVKDVCVSKLYFASLLVLGLLGCSDGEKGGEEVQLTLADASVTEGDSGTVSANFTVALSTATTQTVTVDYETEDSSATVADGDYSAASGTLTFSPSNTSQVISVTVHGDTQKESDETFSLTLSNPVNGTLGDANAIGTIVNDDTAPTVPSISVADTSVTEGDSGTVNANFTVILSSATTQTVSVDYVTTDSTATTGDGDYTAASGTLTFNPDNTSQVISVLVHGDTQVESDETFSLTLSNPVNGTLGDANAIGTIVNDDTAPTVPSISVADTSVTEGDSGTVNANFTVILSSATTQTVSVDYVTTDSTATTGDGDYTAASGTLTFNPSNTSQTISVLVHGDSSAEPDETFNLTLSNSVNATLADASAIGTITNDDGPEPGLETRPSNTSCIAPDRPETGSIQLNRVFPNLTFALPVAMLQAPNDDSRWFVVEKAGRVMTFTNNPSVTTADEFVDIRSRVNSSYLESGLLGMAFDPDFSSNGYVYLSYTVDGSPLTSRIARYTSNDAGQTLDAGSEQIILDVPQPDNNHNGGNIAFGSGPSTGKYLYIGLGDGGGSGDFYDNGQDTKTLLGAMLRIDVDVNQTDWNSGIRYHIPNDNPFSSNAKCNGGSGTSACPEIYAWGLRNPWRWSFDRETEHLWAGDVGQSAWEEINFVELSNNYGWNIREGAHCFPPSTTSCNTTGLTDPVAEYARGSLGFSVTGGYVYRGAAMLGLRGTYVYGDYGSGRIWGLDITQSNPTPVDLLNSSYNISSFAEDNDGELYVVNYSSSGTLYRIAEASSGGDPFPSLLSETGCMEPLTPTQPIEALIPYEINAPFWSDGVEKLRYLSLPNSTAIHINDADDWEFPIGSVLLKNFRIAGNLIETRLLMHHTDGTWGGYSYEWNDAQTDATLVANGKTKVIGSQNWLYPSTSQCLQCHTQAAGRVLGPETAQMNRDFTFPSTGRTANQLHAYDYVNLFDAPLSDIPANLPKLTDPTDAGANLHTRARAYLHTNCGQCHQPSGPTASNMNLLYTASNVQMNICDVAPTDDLGISGARLVLPGDPEKSVLLQRMKLRNAKGMPPVGSFLVDTEGAALLESWITSMGGSCP